MNKLFYLSLTLITATLCFSAPAGEKFMPAMKHVAVTMPTSLRDMPWPGECGKPAHMCPPIGN